MYAKVMDYSRSGKPRSNKHVAAAGSKPPGPALICFSHCNWGNYCRLGGVTTPNNVSLRETVKPGGTSGRGRGQFNRFFQTDRGKTASEARN